MAMTTGRLLSGKTTGGLLQSTTTGRITRGTTTKTHCTRPLSFSSTSSASSSQTKHRLHHHSFRRYLTTSPNSSASRSTDRTARLTLLSLSVGLGLGGSAYLLHSPVQLDASLSAPHDEPSGSLHKNQPPLSSLIRAYVVYTLCSIPALVDASPALLKHTFAIPGVRWIAEKVVRGTFFAQFVGGDTAEEAIPIVAALRGEGKGTLFAYSVEVDEEEASGSSGATASSSHDSTSASPSASLPIHKRIVEEMVHSIDVAADFEDGIHGGRGQQGQGQGQDGRGGGRRTWVAVKLTALLPNAHALHRLSAHLVRTRPPLPAGEVVPFPGVPRDADLDVLDAVSVDADTGAVSAKASALPRNTPLSVQDLRDLKELKEDLFRICKRAEERGVRIIIDAEYSWYQPAIDAYTLALMRTFNRLSSSPASSSKLNFKKLFGGSKGSERDSPEGGRRVQPLVYATYQAYLRRTPAQLAHDITAARAEGFALGVKLVRGAYHPHEIAAHPSSPPSLLADSVTLDAVTSPEVSTAASASPAEGTKQSKSKDRTTLSISPEPVPPVWLVKDDSDTCYNACVALLVGAVAQDVRGGAGSAQPQPGVGVLFGTHNWRSCDVVLDALVRAGLATRDAVPHVAGEGGGGAKVKDVVTIPDEVCERVTMGQLYGMSDALTESIVERTRTSTPFVIKYVPYGALVEVMPYLSRRAIENKTILGGRGGAADERRRAGQAIAERLFGVFGFRAS